MSFRPALVKELSTVKNEIVGPRLVCELPAMVPIRKARLGWQKLGFILAVLIPALGVVAAPLVSLKVGFSWIEPVTFIVMYLITGFGIEVGYHRLFAHRAFHARPWVRVVLAMAGNTAVQGPVVYWVAHHRLHHSTADTGGDPHTPYHHPKGRVAGFLHAHVGWIFADFRALPARYARELLQDRAVMTVNRFNLLWIALGLAAPALVGGLGSWSWQGALVGFLWGGLLRVFVSQHVTYLVNSLCHVSGQRPFSIQERAGNVLWLAIPSLGASLHNNHHAYPASAAYDFRWRELDLSGCLIRLLGCMGLAWDLKSAQRENTHERSDIRAN